MSVTLLSYLCKEVRVGWFKCARTSTKPNGVTVWNVKCTILLYKMFTPFLLSVLPWMESSQNKINWKKYFNDTKIINQVRSLCLAIVRLATHFTRFPSMFCNLSNIKRKRFEFIMNSRIKSMFPFLLSKVRAVRLGISPHL